MEGKDEEEKNKRDTLPKKFHSNLPLSFFYLKKNEQIKDNGGLLKI